MLGRVHTQVWPEVPDRGWTVPEVTVLRCLRAVQVSSDGRIYIDIVQQRHGDPQAPAGCRGYVPHHHTTCTTVAHIPASFREQVFEDPLTLTITGGTLLVADSNSSSIYLPQCYSFSVFLPCLDLSCLCIRNLTSSARASATMCRPASEHSRWNVTFL